ncbi:uncharacterized protein PG998_006000 [Apiospora kogelbergensis]|uniref:Uncharacterized protein n=1 Tax=Apiospora kogelbergensis TaxID=1337665 RepID=A0AAW0R466_9PEZI
MPEDDAPAVALNTTVVAPGYELLQPFLPPQPLPLPPRDPVEMWAISGCLATARVLLEKTKQELPRVFDELIERCGNWLEATDFDDAGDPLNDRGRPGQQQFEILRDNYLEVSAHLNTSEYILSNLEEEQHVIDLWEAAFAWYEINQASRYIEALSRDIRRLSESKSFWLASYS